MKLVSAENFSHAYIAGVGVLTFSFLIQRFTQSSYRERHSNSVAAAAAYELERSDVWTYICLFQWVASVFVFGASLYLWKWYWTALYFPLGALLAVAYVSFVGFMSIRYIAPIACVICTVLFAAQVLRFT